MKQNKTKQNRKTTKQRTKSNVKQTKTSNQSKTEKMAKLNKQKTKQSKVKNNKTAKQPHNYFFIPLLSVFYVNMLDRFQCCAQLLYMMNNLCMRTNEVCSHMSSEHLWTSIYISDVLYVCALFSVYRLKKISSSYKAIAFTMSSWIFGAWKFWWNGLWMEGQKLKIS